MIISIGVIVRGEIEAQRPKGSDRKSLVLKTFKPLGQAEDPEWLPQAGTQQSLFDPT